MGYIIDEGKFTRFSQNMTVGSTYGHAQWLVNRAGKKTCKKKRLFAVYDNCVSKSNFNKIRDCEIIIFLIHTYIRYFSIIK